MRSRKALINTIVQIILEIVTIISGFILPRMIIGVFGSKANGLVVSITQFFGYLTLLQSGIGGVAKAGLYKPLAEKDTNSISSLVKAIELFFQKIGYISIIYLLVLMVLFPKVIYPAGRPLDTAILVFVIWIGIFSQYYFGVTYQFLLEADQRYYIYSITQIIVVIINTVLSVILIELGFNLITVKLVSSIIFLVRPVLLGRYCRKYYKLQKNAKPNNSLIKQRWDGFGHTIAYFIHSKTDVFVLTIFSTLENVSIYSVYASIASGLSLLLNTVANSVQSAFGNMIARQENDTLRKNFNTYACLNNALVMILFGTAIITVIPFMRIYTRGFHNTEYINKLFSFLLLLAEASYCIRMPYQTVVLAAGHYRQTRNGAFAEAGLNIIISLILVKHLGIIGVTIGTLVAMVFRTIQYILYLSTNIIVNSPKHQILYLVLDIIVLSLTYGISMLTERIVLVEHIQNYFQWGLYAVIVLFVVSAFVLLLLGLIDRASIRNIKILVKRNLKRN